MLADLPLFSQSKRVFFSTSCVAWKKHQKRVRLWNSLAAAAAGWERVGVVSGWEGMDDGVEMGMDWRRRQRGKALGRRRDATGWQRCRGGRDWRRRWGYLGASRRGKEGQHCHGGSSGGRRWWAASARWQQQWATAVGSKGTVGGELV
jgi:hypothetical protein